MPPKVYKKPVPSAKVEKPIPTEQSRDNSNESNKLTI